MSSSVIPACKVEIGYGWRSLWQPRSEPEAGA